MSKQIEPAQSQKPRAGQEASAAFASAKRRLQSLRRKMAENFLDMAAEVESLRAVDPEISVEELTEWLRSKVGLSFNDATSYLHAHAALGHRAQTISDHRLSLDVLGLLATCDEGCRTECFARLERDGVLDVATIRGILARNMAFRELSDAAKFSTLQALDNDPSWVVRLLEAKAIELLALMDHLSNNYLLLYEIPELGDDGWCEEEYDREDKGYIVTESQIATKAAEVRTLIELLFGSAHAERADVLDLAMKNSLQASIAFSWHAIQDLASRWFEAFDLRPDSRDLRALRKCVQFLAGEETRALPPATEREGAALATIPWQQFSMIDIAAGVGGASLGLETAGFKPLALYEYWGFSQGLLKKNRPEWDVRKLIVTADPEKLFSEHTDQEIMLLTSGTVLRPVGKKHSYEDFGRAALAVNTVAPTSFFFALDPRVLTDEGFKREQERLFRELGYECQWHRVDVSTIGVPREALLAIVVGMRDGHLEKFQMPLIIHPIRNYVAETLGDAVAAHEWDGTEAPADRVLFDHWLSHWKKRCAGALAPSDLTLSSTSVVKAWAELGIDIDGFSTAAPSPSDVLRSGAAFKLNPEMLKRLQGFPPEWELAGDDILSNPRVLSTSMPPALAKFMGLAIYSAITGERLDIRKALTESLIMPPQRPAMPSRTIEIVSRFCGARKRVSIPVDGAPTGGLRGRMHVHRTQGEQKERMRWRDYWEVEEQDF